MVWVCKASGSFVENSTVRYSRVNNIGHSNLKHVHSFTRIIKSLAQSICRVDVTISSRSWLTIKGLKESADVSPQTLCAGQMVALLGNIWALTT